MNPTNIPTQPEPPFVAAARRTLAAVLAGSVDLETRLAAGSALAVLGDVAPPYPPLPEPTAPLPPAHGVAQAVDELATALRQATTPRDAIRIGLALRELNALPTQGSP